MHLDQLRSFEAVARLRHFTRAAEQLHMAQPSLSRQIASLEAELGAELFHRLRGRIGLTAAGESLLPIARRMLADADAARRRIGELAGLRRGRVRLGATPTLCVSVVAEALRSFHAEYPGIELQVTERGSRELIDRLGEGALDLAIVISPSAAGEPAAIERVPLLSEEIVVVSSAAEPVLPDDAEITLAGLAELPQVLFHRDYDLRATAESAFRDAGLTPRVAVEGAEMDAVLRFAERGIGVALAPATVLVDRPGLRATRLSSPRLRRTVGIACRADVRPDPAAEAMWRMLVETVDRLIAPGTPLARLVTREGSGAIREQAGHTAGA